MMPRGLSWPNLTEGQTFQSPARTITESDVVSFAGMTGDYNPMHVNREFAENSAFGERIAHGLLGLSIAHGLMLGSGLLGDNAIAFLGLSEWNFRAPIRLGDTIHADFEIVELRQRTSHPDQGIVTFSVRVLNQHGELTQSGRKAILMRTANTDPSRAMPKPNAIE
ncbi:MaoC family dehydratase N-terminal domain-containing protein [Mycobacterium sp. 21AC1]|uniref:MaoC/PaaZ C-terminal domain-containing protein n=1 Tax=[Mycobacterium] appelbergii TaxID=2939269 RepID=UPI0029393941|nr:MaoC/PaaZ C-terminal domain-containing protein [Mycobacterium sp. 21AC1]MDV3124120.1 MaoC family dehydratase N-terminal domain-containing protein [Mycobacterium sp. 21AC1]